MITLEIQVKKEICTIINEIIENPSDRADVYQNTCVNLYLGFSHYKETGHLIAWARTIARNECMNYYRNQERNKQILSGYQYYLSEVESQIEIDEIDPKIIAREILDSFKELYKKMDDDNIKKIVGKAFFNEGLKISQISKRYNLSRKTVSRILKGYFVIMKAAFDKACAEFFFDDNYHIN